MQMGGTGTEEERSSSVGPKLVRGERVLGSLGGRQERGQKAEGMREGGLLLWPVVRAGAFLMG